MEMAILDPRIGSSVTANATGSTVRIERVYRFLDGFVQFSVRDENGVGHLLNADECEVQ